LKKKKVTAPGKIFIGRASIMLTKWREKREISPWHVITIGKREFRTQKRHVLQKGLGIHLKEKSSIQHRGTWGADLGAYIAAHKTCIRGEQQLTTIAEGGGSKKK